MEFLQEINWSPLWISLKTGAVATTIAFFLGIFCARKIMKMKPGIESNMGWNPDYATGASADSCWFLFAVDLQSQETFRKISHGEF